MVFDINNFRNTLSGNRGKYKSAYQGYYNIINKDKYINKESVVAYRSLLEKKFIVFCDLSDKVHKWCYEPFDIEYFSIYDRKKHRYVIDFYVEFLNEDKILPTIIEVKYKKEIMMPQKTKNIKKYNEELEVFLKNASKIDAAKNFAKSNDINFLIVDEEMIDKLLNK
jgi:hypothetical protein